MLAGQLDRDPFLAFELRGLTREALAAERLPAELPDARPARLPGLLVRREGDHPAFWPRSESFLAVMDDLYERVRRAQS